MNHQNSVLSDGGLELPGGDESSSPEVKGSHTFLGTNFFRQDMQGALNEIEKGN